MNYYSIIIIIISSHTHCGKQLGGQVRENRLLDELSILRIGLPARRLRSKHTNNLCVSDVFSGSDLVCVTFTPALLIYKRV